MLNNITKKRIDSARNILVGKIPDPKQQVEHITTALLYKFLFDMDEASLNLGGNASHFINEYKEYSWPTLFDKKISGIARLRHYELGIKKLSRNKNFPVFIREIFKDSILTYNDPVTLSLFLKEINHFTYDDSEELGNAYEYLLSILGSQGAAGQFRTPRHIIDFIVETVKPQHNETILDPACGTAGFLISAYKYIVKNKTLNTKTHEKLMNGIVGYDISMDMVKLSQVNMFLHGFKVPNVINYDTLTHDHKWEENFDVILANPPFMSPTGGIRPNSKFSIQAKKSEVLFVNYILEHLKDKGKSAVIVPDGILFNTNKAYIKLRKQLIEEGIVATVSLPSGVFNPYSNIKTSILYINKKIAKLNKKILHIKINNDGFDLGAQRNIIQDNDLPLAKEILINWLEKLSFTESEISNLIDISKVNSLNDYSLLLDKVDMKPDIESKNYPIELLGNLCEIFNSKSKSIKKNLRKKGPYPYYGASGIIDYTNEYNLNEKLVLMGADGAKWGANEKTAFIAEGKYMVNDHAHIIKPNRELLLDDFLMQILNLQDLSRHVTGAVVPGITKKNLKKIEIPLPSIDIQQKLINEINSINCVIESAKIFNMNLKNKFKYFDNEIKRNYKTKIYSLNDLLEYEQPTKYLVSSKNYSDKFKTPVLTPGKTFVLGYTKENSGIFSDKNLPIILFDDFTTAMRFIDFPFKVKSSAVKILHNKNNKKVNLKYLFMVMKKINFNSSTHKRYWISEFSKLKVTLPSIDTQNKVVNEIEIEENIIKTNCNLILKLKEDILKILKF